MASRTLPQMKLTGIDGTGFAHREHRSRRGREKNRLTTLNFHQKRARVFARDDDQQLDVIKHLRTGKYAHYLKA